MTAETLTALFTRLVPFAPTANDMAQGLQSYYTAFREHRESEMDYEALPEYKMKSYIMQVPSDQLWVYTPHFRKFMALAISELFKTKITLMSFSSSTIEQTLLFVNDQKKRWIMQLEPSDSDPHVNKIFMYFPQPNTPLATTCHNTPLEHLVDATYLREKSRGIITEDVERWHAADH